MKTISLASYIDSTNLKPDSRESDIEELCREATQYGVAAVCVHPYRLSLCKGWLAGTAVGLCTVIGFPLGADGLASKSYLSAWALGEGADELDMVINIGALKDGDYKVVRQEIESIAALKRQQHFILKVIVETALMTQDELVGLVEIINQTDADFIKTSTGYAHRGASLDDIVSIKRLKRSSLKIKASGGIRDLDYALSLIAAGADRIGTSNAAKLLQACPTSR